MLLLVGSHARKGTLIREVRELQLQQQIRKRLVLILYLLSYLLLHLLNLLRPSRVLQADLGALNHCSHLFVLYFRQDWPGRKSYIELFNRRLPSLAALLAVQGAPPPLPEDQLLLPFKLPAEQPSKIASTSGSLQKHGVEHLLLFCAANGNKALLDEAVLPKALLGYCLADACFQVDSQLLGTLGGRQPSTRPRDHLPLRFCCAFLSLFLVGVKS